MTVLHYDLELANQNAQRKFPLDTQATCTDTTGSFTLPDDFIYDMSVSVPADLELGADSMYLQSITAASTGWTLLFAYGDPATLVASCLIPRTLATRYSQFKLVGLPPYSDVNGIIGVWSTTSILEQPAGVWEFDFEGGALDPFVIKPQLKTIQTVRVVNKGQLSAQAVGDLTFVAGQYQRITVNRVPGEPTEIVFSGDSGADLSEDCACGDSSELPCIKSIEDAVPDPDGKIYIDTTNCITVSSDANTVTLEDECCEPCGECQPQEEMTRVERLLYERAASVEALANSMAGTLSSLQIAFTASNVGQGTCETEE